MMERIRLYRYSVGQVDDVLLEEFRKVRPFKRLTDIADVIISEEILHYKTRNVEDIELAEQYVKNLRYRNIGEFITDYMRKEVIDNLCICKNCVDKCPAMQNEFQAGCDRFAKLPNIPSV